MKKLFSNIWLKPFAISFVFLFCLTSLTAHAQTDKAATKQTVMPTDEKVEKAEKIIESAIAVMGGSTYLNVRSSTGRGLFTQYKDGQAGLPSTFVDYIIFPDKERT